MVNVPRTTDELFKFYYQKVKPLYAAVQLQNELPAEVLFEIHAAFDHLSRISITSFGENEEQCVQKAYSHLKRACLDIFKLKVKDIVDHFDELRKLDTSFLDNGEFDRKMRQLMHKIKMDAQEARCFEGRDYPDDPELSGAFDLWEPVFDNCVKFDEEYYLHPHLEWAKKKGFKISLTKFVISIGVSIIAGALGTVFLEDPLRNLISLINK